MASSAGGSKKKNFATVKSGPVINGDIRTVRPNAEAVTISCRSLKTGVLQKNKALLMDSTCWHKIIVVNPEHFTRDVILKSILDFIQPYDLIPVYYMQDKGKVSFLARNCPEAIEKICCAKLTIKNSLTENQSFKLNIVLKFSTTADIGIDVSHNINKVLRKRYDKLTRTLNLERFATDADLTEYTALTQPKLLSYVLHLSRPLKPKQIILSNNDIQNLTSFEAIWKTGVQRLDLRNNLLMSLTELRGLKELNITELWLDGNPLCTKYDALSYTKKIREYCPKIQIIDGCPVSQTGFPSFRRNYLRDEAAFDLVDQFLRYYFVLYDSKCRKTLAHVYDSKALFSMTTNFNQKENTPGTAREHHYQRYSRNLADVRDSFNSHANVLEGTVEIINLLNKLPRTQHDPHSFTVDLIYHTKEWSCFIVTGVFKEVVTPDPNENALLAFHRTFVLKAIQDEYRIMNEQLHVCNASASQEVKAFIHTRRKPPGKVLPPAQNDTQRDLLIDTMKKLTTLTTDWCRKFLEECQYDLEDALLMFVELYKDDKIPSRCFQSTK